MIYRLRYNRRFRQQLDALPGDVRAVARQTIMDLTREPRPRGAKELDNHPGFWRVWLPRNHRPVWHVLEEDQIINLLYIGPKSPDLYEQIGLGKRLREAEDLLAYEIELDRDEAVSAEQMQGSAPAPAVN